jgi:hypothetical protein
MLLAASLLLAETASAAVPSPAALVARLAQPVPSQTPFVEVRHSPMLKQPLRVSGQYRRPDAATLVRQVQHPYSETSTIADGKVRVQREGRADRVFALGRAPELASLQNSFAALLGGDLTTLQRDFQLRSSGTGTQWQLHLQPRASELAARLQQLVLHGSGDELRCIETRPVRGQVQRTLVGGTAQAALAEAVEDGQALQALCQGAGS